MAIVDPQALAELQPTIRRYEDRTTDRRRTKQRLAERGILHTDSRDRVEKRLARMNVDWDLATRVDRSPARATTGRTLLDLQPDDFDADRLGLERLLGRNDLLDVGFLERGCLAARSIGRITVPPAGGGPPEFGTGFLVSPRLLLTNNHVVDAAETASRSFVEFNVQSGPDRLPMTPTCFRLDPASCFVTDEELDFTFVAVRAPGANGEVLEPFAWLPLIEQEGKVLLGERLNIIQHPNGEPKQVALRGNQLVDLLETFLHYETDTVPGSSGAPVLNDQFELVALHHRSVPETNERGDFLTVEGEVWTKGMDPELIAWRANEGVRISRVIKAFSARRLRGTAKELRSEALDIGPPDVAAVGAEARPARAPADVATRVTVPLSVTVTVGLPTTG